MAKEKVELSDSEIAERGGMGSVADQEEKDTTESEEDTESEAEEGSEDESKDKSKDSKKEDDEESESDDDESEDEEEEADADDDKKSRKNESDESEDDSEEEDEDEEDDGDEDDDDKSTGRKRTVPYGKLKTERTKRQALQGQITEIHEMLAALKSNKSGKSEDEEFGDLEAAAAELGEEFGKDSKGLAKVLKTAVDLAVKQMGGKVPKELQEKLKLVDKLQEREQSAAESAHFNGEWDKVAPELKKKFPNASASMLDEAKNEMDKLSHGKKYHRYDLDYVLFKEGKRFSTILTAAAGNKSGEGGKQIGTGADESSEDEESLVSIEEITPEIMRNREKKSIARRGTSSKDNDPTLQIFEPIEE